MWQAGETWIRSGSSSEVYLPCWIVQFCHSCRDSQTGTASLATETKDLEGLEKEVPRGTPASSGLGDGQRA